MRLQLCQAACAVLHAVTVTCKESTELNSGFMADRANYWNPASDRDTAAVRHRERRLSVHTLMGI